ncbi:transcriptional regulator [Geomicrobium sp. JCM 19055]|uniref:ArsR/SmtB family transcription factor n=1 Tax=Geomicrobium sp. JCM 19055 TaxID=1460649 RepID=UPI0005A99D53|nr:winged helix-turn-helix domain-containing protein [Geomicrobium sp. JCM 19055]
MKEIFVMTTYEQVRAVSDSFRSRMLVNFGTQPLTGQQLAEKLDISRSKIHYHLNELEKNGIIEIVRREEKNGIMQKFYQPVAKSYIVDDKLLDFFGGSDLLSKGSMTNTFRGDQETFEKFMKRVNDDFQKALGEYSTDDPHSSEYVLHVDWYKKDNNS